MTFFAILLLTLGQARPAPLTPSNAPPAPPTVERVASSQDAAPQASATTTQGATAESTTSTDAASVDDPGLIEELSEVFQATAAVFSRGDALARPDALAADLSRIAPEWAVAMVIVGVLGLVFGAKYYQAATVGLMLAGGATLGYWVGATIAAPPMLVAACVGSMLAVIAFPLLKYAVAVLGGLCGAFLGANAWSSIAAAIEVVRGYAPAAAGDHWIGALVGLVGFGLLAFLLFRFSVAMFTSVAGATLAVLGVLAIMIRINGGEFLSSLGGSSLVLPILVGVPAIIGLVVQERLALRKPKSGVAGSIGGAGGKPKSMAA
ncbi:MAG: hypothetical protein AAF288_08925 [Planctomycetota bacterium]